jgi:hypothetical protein
MSFYKNKRNDFRFNLFISFSLEKGKNRRGYKAKALKINKQKNYFNNNK